MLKSILFVCAGNTCRSPMAMILAKHLLSSNIQIDSAGVAVIKNDNVNSNAIYAVKELYGFDLTNYKAKSINSIHLEKYDYVIALDYSVYKRLEKAKGFNQSKCIIWNIPDPYEQGMDAYKETLQKLEIEISALNSELTPKLDQD